MQSSKARRRSWHYAGLNSITGSGVAFNFELKIDFWKHCRSRSAGFWSSQLIRIHTVFPHWLKMHAIGQGRGKKLTFIGPDRQKVFSKKILNAVLPINFNICFGRSKELSQRDSSFEYPQHMFWLRNKKIIFWSHALIYLEACHITQDWTASQEVMYEEPLSCPSQFHAEYFYVLHSSPIFILLTCTKSVVSMYFHSEWKTVWILIRSQLI